MPLLIDLWSNIRRSARATVNSKLNALTERTQGTRPFAALLEDSNPGNPGPQEAQGGGILDRLFERMGRAREAASWSPPATPETSAASARAKVSEAGSSVTKIGRIKNL